MKRRNFLASIASIFSVSFVAKKTEEKACTLGVDLAENEPDRHSTSVIRVSPDGTCKTVHRFESIYTGKDNRMWQEWTNDGRMIEHSKHPGNRPDSFVVEVFQNRHPVKLLKQIS